MTRTLLAMVAVIGLGAVAHANADLPKKDRERAGKSIRTKKLPVPGKKPAKLVNLYNTWTHEWLAVEVGAGAPARTVDRFLRDHFTNKPNGMEPRLLGILMSAAASFGSDQVMVVSAFRHPKYNLILRKKGHQVARDSAHSHGNAVDFYIPRVTTMQLHAWAKAQGIGGVGLYLDSGFIHMDTGKIRFWSGE
jgi:uncharacterized protein YcbK (DUF882 family)